MDTTEITFRGVEIKVGYIFDAGEPTVFYYGDGSGHPGSPPSVEICEMTIKGVDVMELLDEHISEIEETILNEIEK